MPPIRVSLLQLLKAAGGQQPVRAEASPPQLVQPQDVVPGFCAFTRYGFARISPTQDFGRIEEGDSMRETLQQERSIYFSTTLDQQTRDLLRAKLAKQPV